jgi:polyphosphate:AMP phosphotransferase
MLCSGEENLYRYRMMMTDVLATMAGATEMEKAEYKEREEKIRMRLLELQKMLATSGKSVLILMNGVEGSGKGETTKKLLEWMDARGVETTAFWTPAGEESDYPPHWRFWNKLPAHGRIGIFFGSWYTTPIIERVFRQISRSKYEEYLEDIRKLEDMLTAEGVILVKIWMYLTPEAQKAILKDAQKKSATKWRVSKLTRKFAKKRKRFHKVDLEVLNATHTGHAPWTLVDARFPRYREIFVGETLIKKLEEALIEKRGTPQYAAVWSPARSNYLTSLDSTLRVTDDEYKESFNTLSTRIARLSDELSVSKKSLLLVFEGPDAAGKGGAIRRVIHGIDPRHYRVNAVAAPTDEEKSHPYMWRFWRRIPQHGQVCIFDRSWYGRVLVERIEKFCTEAEWQRAYGEMRDFEHELTQAGTNIRKFYLSITSDEQLARFKNRQLTPYKQYKLTEEDWRNRDKWHAYEAAANDMFENTSTPFAPWILVEANDKNHARIKVMKTVVGALEEALK